MKKKYILNAGALLFTVLLLGIIALGKPVWRADPREGILDASLVVTVHPLKKDRFKIIEVFLGDIPAGDHIALPNFRLSTPQMDGPDTIVPFTPDTRVLLFLKNTGDGWKITQYERCFFWVDDPSKIEELRRKALSAVRLRQEWERVRTITDPRERVTTFWPYMWEQGLSFQQHTQTELEKIGPIAGDFIAQHFPTLNHAQRSTLFSYISKYRSERLHAVLREFLRSQMEAYEPLAVKLGIRPKSLIDEWDRVPGELKNLYGDLYYGLAGLAGFEDKTDLPFVREIAGWALERGFVQSCEAALGAFRHMPEKDNLPVINSIWRRFETHPPDGNGITVLDIFRTLRTHLYPETVPLLIQFLGNKYAGDEAHVILVEIAGRDLGTQSTHWEVWYEKLRKQ